ncbi:gliding motility-associated C-terminal domain-containing protein [Chitinophaga sp. CF418]|nr:gliding motility-associated C-terminal domain-containing protein [Chitinophaga sp. CF418]
MLLTIEAAHTRLREMPCCYLTYSAVRICVLLMILLTCSFIFNVAFAQNLTLQNSSLEGKPGVKVAPPGWRVADNTPDILPGVYGVHKVAKAGKTFIGLQAGPVYREGIEQELSSPLKKERIYNLSFDLAFSKIYGHEHCYGNLAIFGGDTPGDTSELLWVSGSFTDTMWHRWTAEIKPRASHKFISFYAYPEEKCALNSYGVVVFMDNLSTIRQILRTELTATASCNNTSTGSVSVNVTGGAAPYTYLWTPGNYRTPQVSNLPGGLYEVQVTSADGVTAKGAVTVGESDLVTSTDLTLSNCAGDNKNAISLNITGGVPPYDLSVNGIEREGNKFDNLVPGNYVFIVKDKQVCSDTLDVLIKEPDPLVIKQVDISPCSCSEVSDGSIRWVVEGGTRPYKYRVDGDMWQPDSLHSNLKTGSYRYEIEDAKGCGETGTASVTSPWQNCLVVMPSAFSPNGDGNNDLFRPKVYDAVTNYQLKIFNRWGSLVFQTNDPKRGWDGYYSGMPQSSQAFVYVCSFNTSRNELKEYRGTVMLVK